MERTVINLSALEKKYIFSSRISFMSEGGQVDKFAYKGAIAASVGIEKVESAIVEYTASFENCSFLDSFADLKVLVWRGGSLKSLHGLESLKKLNRISILVEKRKLLNFLFCENNKYESLDVNDLKEEELIDIAKAKYIDVLTLRDCRVDNFSFFNECEIRYLDFSVYKNEKISGIHVMGLKKLRFDGCSKLTEIVSDELIDLDFIEVQTCNKFDINSLKSVVKCKSVRVNSCKNPVFLSNVCAIKNLEKLSLSNCKLIIDYEELSFLSNNSTLQTVIISPLKSNEFTQLKEKFPHISWETI